MEEATKNKGLVSTIADRSAVLFVGVTMGTLLGLSFYHDGKPLHALSISKTETLPAPVQVQAPPVAQCSDTFPISPRVVSALRANEPLRVGVFGDSFGDGIWAGTLQELGSRENVEVFRFAQESTGFTRYKSRDLYEDTKQKIADQAIDIALISYGANDTQGVWAEGRAEPYMSPGWQKVVGDRASAIVRMLQAEGIAVGWVGLPRMRRAEYDNQIQQMNGFYAGLMCKLGVPFVNPVGVTQTADKKFSKELVDPDTKKKYTARADDGIHMSVHGYQVVARPLLKRISALMPPETSSQVAGR